MNKNDEAAAAEEKTEAPAETATKKSKGKSKKSAGKGASKGTAKNTAKKAKGKSKDKKPAKEKAPKKPAAERDEFGFRKGSKKSEAAKLYASKKGATLAEVKEKTGSSQLNLLKELEDKGVKIVRSKEAGEGKKQVTRYKIDSGAKSSKKSKKSK